MKSHVCRIILLLNLAFLSCRDSEQLRTDESSQVNDTSNHLITSSPERELTYKFADQTKRFRVSPDNSKKITLQSGTQINIPAYCFVDADGNIVKNVVDITFEEFLSPGSIIASQINMKYDSAGKISDFESAGMFRINGFENGKQVFIAKNKSIEVALATTDTDKNFNAYYSAENGGNWQYLEGSAARPMGGRVEATSPSDTPLPSVPLKPAEYSADGKYFDLNLSRVHSYDLKQLLGVVWEYAGNDKKLDPAVSRVNFNRKWDYVSIVPVEGDKRGIYKISLSGPDTTIKTIARPIYRGAVLDEANVEFEAELGEFNRRMAQQGKLQEQALAESGFVRTLLVKDFGLYNYDRQYHSPDMVPVLANFNFGADSLKKYPITVFLVTGNGMAVIKYPPQDWDKFRYSVVDKNKVIAILPNQEICTFSSSRFKSEAPRFPENNPGNFTFALKPTGMKATNAADLDKILQEI